MTAEMMKKEMMKKMEMLKAETDPSKVEMMKKEMMTAMKEMGDMPEMMKKEMMKKMQEYGSMNAMKEAVTKEGGPGSGPIAKAIGNLFKSKSKKALDKATGKMKPGAGTRAGSAKDGGQTDQEADDYEKQTTGETYTKEKHTPDHKEMSMNAMKMNAMKMPIQSMYGKMNAMKTGDDDLTPMNNMKLNAMIKDPHKSKGDDPKKDMNATYMKSDVRGDVKNGGGTDMSKVNDNPKPMAAMKKINAMYKTEKYLDEKPGSIQNVVAEMYQTGKLKG